MLRMSLAALAALVTVAAVTWAAAPQAASFAFPRIGDYGGVVEVAKAVEPPQAGAKVVLDVTSDSQAGAVNPGLEAAARYLNLHAQAQLSPDDLQLTVVLHGGATKAVLADEHYARRLEAERNPNRELIRRLHEAGVELLVCGQSLARSGYETSEVLPEVGLAVSALTANVNKQQAGYAYIRIP